MSVADRVEKKIRLLDPLDFEELCAELITELGFVDVRRQASGTQFGHDIAAELIAKHTEHWFFECKRYSRNVPLKEISNKLLWAETVASLDYFVVISNAQISNDARQLISMPSRRPFKILTWTGPVFRRLLASCQGTSASWFPRMPVDRNRSTIEFLAEQRGNVVGHAVPTAASLHDTVTVTVSRSRKTPGEDPCYAVITDYFGNEIARVTLRRGRKMHLRLPREAMGKPVRIYYDFDPHACLARHYPNLENIVLTPDLSLPSEQLKDRIRAVASIPFESWSTYMGTYYPDEA
jgi:hypothetical protein